jgi:hypothetical protein
MFFFTYFLFLANSLNRDHTSSNFPQNLNNNSTTGNNLNVDDINNPITQNLSITGFNNNVNVSSANPVRKRLFLFINIFIKF